MAAETGFDWFGSLGALAIVGLAIAGAWWLQRCNDELGREAQEHQAKQREEDGG